MYNAFPVTPQAASFTTTVDGNGYGGRFFKSRLMLYVTVCCCADTAIEKRNKTEYNFVHNIDKL
jgi:hypothetical protein